MNKFPIVYEMKALMEEIVNESEYTPKELEIMDEYFNDFYSFVNTKTYQYALDDNGFVIRKDCHTDKKSIYGWTFVNDAPTAMISKINLRKSKTDITSSKSVYRRIYNEIDEDLDKWLNTV